MKPTAGKILVTPYLPSQAHADEVKARSGLLIAPPDKKNSFEGVPNQGYVYALPEDYAGDLVVGARVVFSENNPTGFKFEGQPLFSLDLEQIVAVIGDES